MTPAVQGRLMLRQETRDMDRQKTIGGLVMRNARCSSGRFWLATGSFLLLTLAGCDTARSYDPAGADAVSGDAVDVADDATTTTFDPTCGACHGTAANPAPPNAIGGATSTAWRGVGAHQTHVRGTLSNNAMACTSCHKVPTSLWDTDHIDAPVDTTEYRATVTFGGLALAGGATPVYDSGNFTCSNVYCHGSKLKTPGKNSKPLWTVVDDSQRACDSCHGAPPAAPHPQTGDCIGCHASTAGPNKTIANKNNHINGKVDLELGPETKCDGCHGLPPVSDKHPKTTEKCAGCHSTTVDSNTLIIAGGPHMNGKVDVVLSGNPPCAGCHGAPPVSDKHPKTNGNCEGCHTTTVTTAGKIVEGGTHNNGKVDVTLGPDVDCAGCHAYPPVSAKHPVTKAKCEGCHTTTVDVNQKIVAGGAHNNGKIDVALSNNATCIDCHVTLPNGPGSVKHPVVNAATVCEGCHTTTVDVNQHIIAGGAHMNTKEDVVLGTSVNCAGCHGAPPSPPTSPKHPLTASKCEGCHTTTVDVNQQIVVGGAHMNGKNDVALSDNANCYDCHKVLPNPPGSAKHPVTDSKTNCEGCHTTTVDKNKHIVSGGTHMDGKSQVALGADANCAGCHGSPPVSAKHPVTTAACEGCHATTVDANKQIVAGGAHMNDKKDVVLSATADCNGCHGAPPISAKHPVTTADCAGCHISSVAANKQIIAGGTHYDGKIDVVLSGTADCAGCHGSPPNTAKHPKTLENCEGCHVTTVDASKQILAGGAHQNGKIDVVLAADAVCNACHGAPPTTPNHPTNAANCEGCHTTTATILNGIVPGGTHLNGTVDVALSANANCFGCHGAPPTINNHPQSMACETCHAATAGAFMTIANSANHRNGKVDIKVTAAADCTACHQAPPNNGKHPQLQPAVQSCHLCHATSVGSDDKVLDVGTHADGKIDFAIATTTCGACHDAPPTKPEHPKMFACNKCHSTTVDANLGFVPNGAHVNGTIDVVLPTSCDACHGGNGSAAPPPDVNGQTDPTLPTVGAHAAHLKGNVYSGGGIACESCHQLPTTVGQAGHLTGTLDSIKFPNGKATIKGFTPDYNPATMTCSNVYCHGVSLADGVATSPVWNKPGLACNSCHGVAPSVASGHPYVDPTWGTASCALCHSKTVNPDGTLNTKDGWHVNGMVNP